MFAVRESCLRRWLWGFCGGMDAKLQVKKVSGIPVEVPNGLSNAGSILSLIAQEIAVSRPALQAHTGLSRVTVTQRVNALLGAGLICESDDMQATGGRPSRVLALNAACGYVLVANIGETQIQLAMLTATAAMIAQSTCARQADAAPEHTLQQIADGFEALRRDHAGGAAGQMLLAISLSLPAPVDYENCRVYGPSVLPGWEDLDIAGFFSQRFAAPVYGENDVNAMTLHQHRACFATEPDLVFIKAGTGIGSGIISQNRLLRGARGVAGDIGHIQMQAGLRKDTLPKCRCGKTGCVEAQAAGWALARDLTNAGTPAKTARDVMAAFTMNQPLALDLVAQSGRILGDVIAGMISVLNPGCIVIGGTLAGAGDVLLNGIRQQVAQQCLPAATQNLRICAAPPARQSELFGAALLALEDVFSSRQVEGTLIRFAQRSLRAMV